MKVLVTEPINEKGIDLLKEHGFEVVNGTGIDPETLVREGKDCDGILTRNAHLTGEIMDQCPKLKVISMHGVGVDTSCDFRSRGIAFERIRGEELAERFRHLTPAGIMNADESDFGNIGHAPLIY